jgi:tetratricopeptide (TPR) repeat protein
MGLTLAREMGHQRGTAVLLLTQGTIELAEEAYGDAEELLKESIAIYREFGQQNNLAVALSCLGAAARGLSQFPQARQHLYEALETATEIQAVMPLLSALPVVALLLADLGEEEQAVELYALASRYPFAANSRWCEDVAGQHIAAVAATLPPDVVAAAQERGRARDLWTTVRELLVELEGW